MNVNNNSNEVKMRYYIASPGFNDEQITKIRSVESELDRFGADYFSPFKNGDNLHLGDDMDLNKIQIKHIFNQNIEEINKSDKMIAIVETFDKGTIFEIGYFAATRDLNSLNRELLMIGGLSENISESLAELIREGKNISPNDFAFVNISEKDLECYLKIGYYYGKFCKVVTYTDKPLDSNVMTACAAFLHFYNDKNQFKDFYDFRRHALKELHSIDLANSFNLGALKLFKKVE